MWVMGWWVGVLPCSWPAPTPASPARMYLVSREQPLSPLNPTWGAHPAGSAPSRHLQVMGGQGAGPLGCGGCSLQQEASGAHVGDGHCPSPSGSAHPGAPQLLRVAAEISPPPVGPQPCSEAWGDLETRGGLRGSKGGEPARPMPTRSPGVTGQHEMARAPSTTPLWPSQLTLAWPLPRPGTLRVERQTPPPPLPKHQPLGRELTEGPGSSGNPCVWSGRLRWSRHPTQWDLRCPRGYTDWLSPHTHTELRKASPERGEGSVQEGSRGGTLTQLADCPALLGLCCARQPPRGGRLCSPRRGKGRTAGRSRCVGNRDPGPPECGQDASPPCELCRSGWTLQAPPTAPPSQSTMAHPAAALLQRGQAPASLLPVPLYGAAGPPHELVGPGTQLHSPGL